MRAVTAIAGHAGPAAHTRPSPTSLLMPPLGSPRSVPGAVPGQSDRREPEGVQPLPPLQQQGRGERAEDAEESHRERVVFRQRHNSSQHRMHQNILKYSCRR